MCSCDMIIYCTCIQSQNVGIIRNKMQIPSLKTGLSKVHFFGKPGLENNTAHFSFSNWKPCVLGGVGRWGYWGFGF